MSKRPNIFEVMSFVDQDNDDESLSDEAEITDEEDWLPHPDEINSDNGSDSDSSDDVELPPTFTDLVTVDRNHPSTSSPIEEDFDVSDTRTVFGKDKETVWAKCPFPEARTPSKNILKIQKNRTPNTNHVLTPTDAFLLYIDTKIIDSVVVFTNIEGRLQVAGWRDTDAVEMKAFIGCLVHTGAMKQNACSLSLLFNPIEGNSLVRAAFSIKRFSSLLNHIRFDDKSTRSVRRERDLFAPIREIWSVFQTNLTKFYHPGPSVTVDEQLVPFRGRCKFIQYMPSKPDKYGLKVFWACDSSTNYPLRGSPYLGKEPSSSRPAPRSVGLGSNIVTSLTEDFQGSGRNVTCDNFFTNLDLAESLARKKLTLVGTVKRNKTFLPKDFQEKKALPLEASKFLFRQESVLVSYQSKKQKNVILLSTMHSRPEVSEHKGKPEIVLTYNKTKGGVDAMDQMAHSFTVKRKTKRWPMVMFFNIIDLSTIASRVVFKMKFPSNSLSHEDNRQAFNINVGRSLAAAQIQRRSSIQQLQEPIKHNISTVLSSLGIPSAQESSLNHSKRPRNDVDSSDSKQKRCSLCPAKKDRKTRSRCSRCGQAICKEHSVLCCQTCSF